ncbi:hypothetical protein H0H92_009520, partial [Tricholoma furcatifolium]
ESPSLILGTNFPCLRSLTLAGFSKADTQQAMSFWERHPSIEYLHLTWNNMDPSNDGSNCWFASPLPDNLLPNLPHLRVQGKDALLLAPILCQLLSLAIFQSVNAQIPYLLRYVCRNGLPKLKSLEIGQRPDSDKRNRQNKGSLWYEREDGSFRQGTATSSRTVFDGFMHSIVRSAPDLEEMGFHSMEFSFSKLVRMIISNNDFYGESGIVPSDHIKRDILASQVKDLADAVPSLVSVTSRLNMHPPYMTARITRDQDKQVASVKVGNGYWMKIGCEDQAFPTDFWHLAT